MITISLSDISHNYKGNTIFSPISYEFSAGSNTVILGKNGSGKSTLLKIISSFMEPSSGCINYAQENTPISVDQVPFLTSICSPSALLEEKLTLSETFDFYFSLRNLKTGLSKSDFFSSCMLVESEDKKVKELSSGMTQRFKLALAFLSETSLIILDEPCMNLDDKGTELYTMYTRDFGRNATQIIASNSVEIEYNHCNAKLHI
ncbi:MAG: ATP-binding cassette domain-containing protein [Flavobacteriales bacterium]